MQVEDTKQKIIDEELEQFQPFFDEAIAQLEKKEPTFEVALNLAQRIKNTGYTETKICSAVVKKLSIINPKTGKGYADADYIRKILPTSMKDYIRGKKRITKLKEKEKTKNMHKIEADINKEIEIAKEKGIKEAEEITEVQEPYSDEIEIEEDSDVIVHTEAPADIVIARKDNFEGEIEHLKEQVDAAKTRYERVMQERGTALTKFDELRKDYEELLQKYNYVMRPFLERRWIIVKIKPRDGGEPWVEVVEADAVANPVTKRINIPKDTKNQSFSRSIPFEEMEQHKEYWETITKGRMSVDVNTKSKTTTTDKSQQST